MDTQADKSVPILNLIDPHMHHSNLSSDNFNSLDWSCTSFLSFGCYNKAIIVDYNSNLNVIQTLTKHKSNINRTKWIPSDCKTLLTTDVNDHIIIWDVIEGFPLTILSTDSKELKGLVDIVWTRKEMNDKNELEYNVMCLYLNNLIVLYDSEEGNILWKKSLFTQKCDLNSKAFQINPFNSFDLLVSLSSVSPNNHHDNSFVLIKDYQQTKLNIKRFQIFQRNADHSPKSPHGFLTFNKLDYFLEESNLNIFKEDNPNSCHYPIDCIKIKYSNSVINQLLILLSRKLLIVDLQLLQIVCVIPFERNSSIAIDFYSCWQRNLLITLHEPGTIIVRLANKALKENQIGVNLLELTYPTLCLSDGLRLTKHNKIFGLAVSLPSEIDYALLSSNGKLFIYKLHKKSCNISLPHKLSDLIKLEEYYDKRYEYGLIMKNMMNSLSNGPHVIKMCPPVTVRNWQAHKPYLAVGDLNGSVFIYNTSTKIIEKELAIHSSPIRGIEWASLGVFLSYAYHNISRNSGKVINELNVTDIVTGRSEPLRQDRTSESSPIEILRISNQKQYFIIAFKSDPLEIWDLKKLSLLRVLTKVSFLITALEWTPTHSKQESSNSHTLIRENFVLTSAECELYHFSIFGNVVRQISSTSDMNNGSITCMTGKSDLLVLGDSEGNINVWFLKDKESKTLSTEKGWIKKIRFSPGRGNLKCLVLYTDEVGIYDLKELKLVANIKYPRDMLFKVQDIDWASCDRPILSSSDGSVYIMDLTLKQYTSPLKDNNFKENSGSYYHILPSLSKFICETRFLHKLGENMRFAGCNINQCILFAKKIGDIETMKFWQLVSHHLFSKDEEYYQELDANYDIYLDKDPFRKMYKERISLYELMRSTPQNNHRCCEYHIWLGNHQRAVQILLETEPGDKNNQNFYIDSLKACLISLLGSGKDSNESHPILKLVATNLIANGNISEGVQLLYLIGKCQDACRYLQSYGLWDESILVAKMNLDDNESSGLINNWLNHLESKNLFNKKLFTLLSVKLFEKAIESLFENGFIRKAALLTDLCIEKSVIDLKSPIIKNIYVAYAEKLEEAGFKELSYSYRTKIPEA